MLSLLIKTYRYLDLILKPDCPAVWLSCMSWKWAVAWAGVLLVVRAVLVCCYFSLCMFCLLSPCYFQCWWSDFMFPPSAWWSLAYRCLATVILPVPENDDILGFMLARVFALTVSNLTLSCNSHLVFSSWEFDHWYMNISAFLSLCGFSTNVSD